METMQPTLKRGRDVWDQINMPEKEFQERVEKIKKEMEKEGVDVLLLYGNGVNAYGNPCYVSNFLLKMSRGVLAVIPRKGEIALIYEGFSRDLPAAKVTTWVEEVRACPDVSKECIKYLKEENLIPSTIGFVGLREIMPYYQFQSLSESLDQCRIVDAERVMRDMRMVKSQKECDQIRRTSRIVNNAFDLITNTPLTDMNERILEATVDREVRLEGAEDIRMLIAKPQETSWAFRPAEDVPVSDGDILIIYLAIEFERYWSEGVRTFVAKPSSFMEATSNNAKALYGRIVGRMKPGKALSQFYGEALCEIKESHIDYLPEYGMGQGIGLSLQEFPVIAEEDTGLLKEGMCITLRLAVKDREMGANMTGNTILLSKNSTEVLTK